MILKFAEFYEKEELIEEIGEKYLEFKHAIDFFYNNFNILK